MTSWPLLTQGLKISGSTWNCPFIIMNIFFFEKMSESDLSARKNIFFTFFETVGFGPLMADKILRKKIRAGRVLSDIFSKFFFSILVAKWVSNDSIWTTDDGSISKNRSFRRLLLDIFRIFFRKLSSNMGIKQLRLTFLRTRIPSKKCPKVTFWLEKSFTRTVSMGKVQWRLRYFFGRKSALF